MKLQMTVILEARRNLAAHHCGQQLCKEKDICQPMQMLMILPIGLKLYLDIATEVSIKDIEKVQFHTKGKNFILEVQS